MESLNMPWSESPFFQEELEKRDFLSEEEKKQAEFFNRNGYLLVSDLLETELIERTRSELENRLNSQFSLQNPRSMNLWQKSNGVKEIATAGRIDNILKMLYERSPIPFQTLNFKYGSRQNPHSDLFHFSSFPERYMCAAWVALEDMDEENGTVAYYPGSHRLNIYGYQHLSSEFNTIDNISESFSKDRYEPIIERLMKAHEIAPKALVIKKGDILIWSANLIHGGLPIRNFNRTRWSQVTHYYFENCLYYTPQLSNPVSGEWFLRKIFNIRTGEYTWGDYNGYKPKRKVVPGYRYLISDYAPYNWRDLLFGFTRLYYRLSGKRGH